jgi:hypothetical protein
MREAKTKVVKTNAQKAGFNSGQDFIRGVNDNFDNSHNTNDEIKAGLLGELKDQFELWREVFITPPSEQDKIRYENFIMGYIYRHDMEDGEPDHSVYFKWEPTQKGSLYGRVFVSPLLVPHVSTWEPAKSLVVDAAADTTDPPDSTTPPPPLNGISS